MKTKNVKVRFQDIKAGRIIYISHPVYGIESFRVTSKPFYNIRTDSYFVNVVPLYGYSERLRHIFTAPMQKSLCDMGVPHPEQVGKRYYNGRRTFFKLRQAEAWQEKWDKDKGFQSDHARHLEFNRSMVSPDFLFEEDWRMDEHYMDQEENSLHRQMETMS